MSAHYGSSSPLLPSSAPAYVGGTNPQTSKASAISSLAPEAGELWTGTDFARLEEIERAARWRGDDLVEAFLEDQRIPERLAEEAVSVPSAEQGR